MGNSYKIAVIPGDGTGPEVIDESIKVLDAVAAKFDFSMEKTTLNYDGANYLKTGIALPEDAIETLRGFDAILLGAIGHPDVAPGILEKGILLRIRFELDQYINLRPVKLYDERFCPLRGKGPDEVDFVVIRENTEGLYSGMGGFQYKDTPHEVATQIMCSTRRGAERCLRYAFELTRKRDRKKMLTLCAKTNVLTFAHDMWWRAFNEVGEADYPDIKRDYAHVDATTMWMVKNPEFFDVIVTPNMFGDIITDLGAQIQGGMGIAAGGNLNPDPEGVSMFEPIGGSAPKYTGQGVINPLAAIAAGQMLLEHIGEADAAAVLEKAVIDVTCGLDDLGAGRMGASTSEVGDRVAEAVSA